MLSGFSNKGDVLVPESNPWGIRHEVQVGSGDSPIGPGLPVSLSPRPLAASLVSFTLASFSGPCGTRRVLTLNPYSQPGTVAFLRCVISFDPHYSPGRRVVLAFLFLTEGLSNLPGVTQQVGAELGFRAGPVGSRAPHPSCSRSTGTGIPSGGL